MFIRFVELQNFKSFVGTHSLAFDGRAGLYLMTGDNRVEPKLGANGAGKSTIWDAISWCLFGKTLRGVRARNVVAWSTGAKANTLVTVALQECSVRRMINPIALEVDAGNGFRKVDQDYVEKLVGLDHPTFQQAVIVGQFSSMFFDLDPTPKLELFSAVLGLDVLVDKSKTASGKAAALERVYATLESRLTAAQGKLEAVREQIADTVKRKADWVKERESSVALLKEEKNQLEKQLAAHRRTMEDVVRQGQAAKKTVETEQSKVNAVLEKADRLTPTINGLQQEKAQNRGRVGGLESALRRLESVKGSCPICRQKVSEKHIKEEKDRLGEELSDIERVDANLQETLNGHLERQDVLKQEARKLAKERVAPAQETYEHVQASFLEGRRLVDRVESSIRVKAESLDDLKAETNPFDSLLAKARESRDQLKASIDADSAEREEVGKKLSAVQYWVKGFKQFRLFLVEEALQTLGVEVNNALGQLGLDDWTITFDVERETQSGSISRGFQVFVRSPGNAEPVPWESWSGGEGQRLRIAGTMGLASLIWNSRNVSANVEVWDEPTQHLSEQGVENLMDLLAERARTLKKQIWVVDHRSLDYGGFAQRINIVKDDKGSRVEGA